MLKRSVKEFKNDPVHHDRREPRRARIVRAAYRAGEDLLGREMLLEGRILRLRFCLGVRGTGVIDQTRDGDEGSEQVWGGSYETLQGHLERRRISYEVIKNLASGQVAFRVTGYYRRARNPSR